MRDISVDKKGLSFSLSVLTVVFLFVGLWSLWVPLHRSVVSIMQDTEKTLAATEAGYHIKGPATAVQHNTLDEDRYIRIDRDGMNIALVEGEFITATFPIIHFPETQSPDSPPEGVYTVDEKTKTRFSTITKVRYPYYVTFGDRYAIHGTPTDAEGDTLTEQPFSGSKITVDTDAAQNIFSFADAGTSILVSSYTKSKSKINETVVTYEELPATSAQSYILSNLETGEIFLSKHENDRYPIASITKLITAAVATDVIGHADTIKAPDSNEYTLSDLYYPLLLHSDNAVAEYIAKDAGYVFFLSNMNAYVHALGMTRTSFADTSGLSPKNTSTANDLLLFAQHLHTKKQFLFDISHEESVTITSTAGTDWHIVNQNKLARDPHFYGGKLGYTDEAGQTSLAVFTVPLGEETYPIAVIVLNSKNWKQDTRTLLGWLIEHAK